MRICGVNTFVSCGNLTRAMKIRVSTVFLAYIYCILFASVLSSSLVIYLYIQLYYMKFYRVWSCLTAELFFVLFCFTECFVGAYGLTWMSSSVRFWSLLNWLIKKINLFL
jgi:hypothetical protein